MNGVCEMVPGHVSCRADSTAVRPSNVGGYRIVLSDCAVIGDAGGFERERARDMFNLAVDALGPETVRSVLYDAVVRGRSR